MKRVKSDGKALILALGAAVLPWHITGCISPQAGAPAEEYAGSRADIRILKEDIARLEGDIEQVNMQLEEMSKLQARTQSTAAHAGNAQISELERQSRDVQERIDRLDAARASDREEIINSITSRVTKILESQSPRTGPRTTSTGGGSSGGSQTGYEHIVESGQTLSAIAKAYGVNMKTIIQANNLSDPNSLRSGQKLFIPE
jgi:LysM repeat protein